MLLKKSTNTLFVAALALGLSSCSSKCEKAAPQPASEPKYSSVSSTQQHEEGLGRTTTRLTEVTATVKAVDVANRRITVVGPNQKVSTFDVDPAVERLREIKPGDKIEMQYYQSLAFVVREPTAQEKQDPRSVTSVAGRNSKALPPGMGAARTVHTIVTIEGIDKTNQTVTIRNPEGRVVEVGVMEPKNLDRVKIGDTIAVTFTERLAVGINPAT